MTATKFILGFIRHQKRQHHGNYPLYTLYSIRIRGKGQRKNYRINTVLLVRFRFLASFEAPRGLLQSPRREGLAVNMSFLCPIFTCGHWLFMMFDWLDLPFWSHRSNFPTVFALDPQHHEDVSRPKLMPQNSERSTLPPIRFPSFLAMRLYLNGYA